MSDARLKLERLFNGPAPAPVAPPRPDVKPDTRPAPAPTRPQEPQHPNPWRRREMKPGETERPRAQAALRREAVDFLKSNGLDEFV